MDYQLSKNVYTGYIYLYVNLVIRFVRKYMYRHLRTIVVPYISLYYATCLYLSSDIVSMPGPKLRQNVGPAKEGWSTFHHLQCRIEPRRCEGEFT